MRLAHLSIGLLGNKPHLENIDSDIKSAPTTVKVPQGLPSSLLFTPLLSHNLYNYTATTAVALDAALLSRPPDEKWASFSTETTPRQHPWFLQFLIPHVATCSASYDRFKEHIPQAHSSI
jgi:hypothetical protein